MRARVCEKVGVDWFMNREFYIEDTNTNANTATSLKCLYSTCYVLCAREALFQGLYMKKARAKATDTSCYGLNVCIPHPKFIC